MFSSCVLFHEQFTAAEWTRKEFESLQFLSRKFDFFLLPSKSNCLHFADWKSAHFNLHRIVGEIDSHANFNNFITLPLKKEYAGNIDIFINFPADLRSMVENLFPHRQFLSLSEVLTEAGGQDE